MDDRYYPSTASGVSGSAVQVKQPPLARIYNALQKLGGAAELARNVGNTLAGSQPEDAGKAVNAVGHGLFDEMDLAAERIKAFAGSIISDMQRIQNRL